MLEDVLNCYPGFIIQLLKKGDVVIFPSYQLHRVNPVTKGKRYSLPNSRIMVHQPSAGFQGQATDIQIHAKEILSLKERLNKIYSKHTGKSIKEISDALERDYFMTADEAKKFGLIDSVVEKRK